MRKAIVYASVHHGNTEKIVKSIAEECQVDLIDAVKQSDADLSSYDMIGFASGIYFSKFHQSILKFAEKNLPDDKKVFLICTYGGSANYKSIEQILDKKHASVALIVRSRMYVLLKDEMEKLDKKPNYMTVPEAIRELEKIELVRQTDGKYRMDHAVTAIQKIILKAFDMDAEKIQDKAVGLSRLLEKYAEEGK